VRQQPADRARNRNPERYCQNVTNQDGAHDQNERDQHRSSPDLLRRHSDEGKSILAAALESAEKIVFLMMSDALQYV